MATIKDVARHANVSIATVSRVINEPDKVKEPTRKRVEAVMQELSFSRNALAASLVTRRTGCIGLIIPQLSGAFFAPLISAVEHTVRAGGSHLVVSCGNCTQAEVLAALGFLKQRSCDAIIVTPGALEHETLVNLLETHPNILIIHRLVPGYEHRCVVVDNYQGAFMAVSHLIEQGHRRIAAVTGPHNNPESMDRLRGMRDAMTKAGLPLPDNYVFEGIFGPESGLAGAEAFLALSKPPTAVFCFNDQTALGVLDYCKRRQIAVPADMAVMGFDDVEFADLVSPRLTTVHQPIDTIGRTAGTLALRLAKREAMTDDTHVIQPRLALRESVAVISN